ncbi:uncharacterized protein SAPINGB_P004860 [Magnusiomyces paraingens]|uniref:GOLD domain-containing protein n=1 Tax=Magnusiomyces paraingens TaxID=2606893 RepID=A0A5E8BWY2_9ASCO|nr:uncharacterized protein SAPINGB_P004860 [Saprochaete ingens]VVT56149.1 unnamed protein product [Saprochaete ingens]
MRAFQLLLTLVCAFLPIAAALKFQIEAKQQGYPPRCIRDFIQKGKMVVVKVTSSGQRGDGQNLNLHIHDNKGNEYGRKKDVAGDVRLAFTAHDDASIDICFENIGQEPKKRDIELNVEIGPQARDWNQIQAAEKLKPTELELRRIEELTDEVQRELEYLKIRETRLRDTNESTNRRVKLFSIGVVTSLVSLGLWQTIYLRSYFKSKHII